jgi:hypothetical protein
MKKLLALSILGMMCVPSVLTETNVLKQGSTIGIRINTDRSGTIENAFTTALSAAGFIIDKNNSDYLLNVTITVTLLVIPNVQMVFVQFELIANLLDNNGRILLPYTISWRQGHITQELAEIRAFREAVIKINAEYGKLLSSGQ